jgi:predicted Zn-dependent protease
MLRGIPASGGLLVALFLGAVGGPPALAHLGVEEQIAVLDKLLEAKPEDATLYLRRGELHRIHKDWESAERDYLQARKLNPDLAAVELCLGRMRFEAGDARQALEHLERYFDDFTAALARAGESASQPEIYLERARALVAAGPAQIDRALRGLDEGLQELGEPVSLQLYAVELEVGAARFDAALRRLDRLAAGSVRKEPWLMRKGAVLEAAGRPDEAGELYSRALDAISSLPASRRDTRAVRRMESEARAGLERVERAGTTP